jgi:hypothetical protein
MLYERYDPMDQLKAYKVCLAPKDPAGKFETGTGNFEGMCGVLGALEVTTRLGLEGSGGMVRVGPVHYNSLEAIRKFGKALGRMAVNEE